MTQAKAATAAKSPLNVRLTVDDLDLLGRLVKLQERRVKEKAGDDAIHLDVSRASVIRQWIRNAAIGEGMLARPKPAKKAAKKGGA